MELWKIHVFQCNFIRREFHLKISGVELEGPRKETLIYLPGLFTIGKKHSSIYLGSLQSGRIIMLLVYHFCFCCCIMLFASTVTSLNLRHDCRKTPLFRYVSLHAVFSYEMVATLVTMITEWLF
jgi:hypothetical protein